MVALHAEAEGKWERRWGPTRRADEEEEEGGGGFEHAVARGGEGGPTGDQTRPWWLRAARRAGAGERGSSACGPRWG
jgi:hypothetical protein